MRVRMVLDGETGGPRFWQKRPRLSLPSQIKLVCTISPNITLANNKQNCGGGSHVTILGYNGIQTILLDSRKQYKHGVMLVT